MSHMQVYLSMIIFLLLIISTHEIFESWLVPAAIWAMLVSH